MASSGALDAELARLSGSELVARLRTTCRVADYEAVARVLDARDVRLRRAEAALAEAKEGLDARDRKIAEANKALDARDARLAKAEAALAEAEEGLNARDSRLGKVEAALAEAKKGLKSRDARLAKVEAALTEAKKGLAARDRNLAKANAELAEAKKGLAARDRRLAEVKVGLDARSGRLAKAEAELAENKEGLNASDAKRAQMEGVLTATLAQVAAVTAECNALKAALVAASLWPVSDGARPGTEIAAEKGPVVIDIDSSDEEGEGDERRGGDSGISRKRKPTAAASACSPDDEDDSLTLSQLIKKKRDGDHPEADGEPKKADSARPLGDFLPEVPRVIKKELTEATDGGSDEPNVANFVKRRGNVELGEDGGMSRAMPSPQPLGSAVAVVNSAGPLGIDLPGIPLVIKKEPVEEATHCGSDDPKVANFVQERGNVKSANNSGVSRGMLYPPTPGFDARTWSQNNFSKAGHSAVRIADKEGSLGTDLPKTPVITEVASVHGRGNGKSPPPGYGARTRSPPPGYAARTRSPPPGFAPRTGSQRNLSIKADHDGPGIAGKDGSFAGQEVDTFAQMKIPSLSATKIVESARAGSVSLKGHSGSALDGSMVLGLVAIREQEKTNGGEHSAKRNETKETNGIGNQRGKLRSYKNTEISDGGQLKNSDKLLGPATLQPRDELHAEQISVEGSLPLVVTRNWKYEADMLISCLENKKLCMQAACALYRQKKLMFQPVEGGRSGSGGLSKSDAHRATRLVEFMLDGNGQGSLKTTLEELVKHDSTGPSFLEKVVCQLRDQLFYIYKNKEDPYFR